MEDSNALPTGDGGPSLVSEPAADAVLPSEHAASDADFGFERAEFGQEELAGSVNLYERHVFLCYKSPLDWPSHVEAPESDRLPRLLAAAIQSRKSQMKRKTILTICEGEDSNESSNGDLLIFPDMIRYRRLTHFDVENFVEEVLVKEAEWLPGAAEPLTGSFVFVCSHGSRDRRCGVCGPAIIEKFRDEISSHALQGQVSVSPCSHVGGHKYAGNVIIYSQKAEEVTGDWYGYVSPNDVPALIDQHIGKGEILAHLWRGQMGMPKEEQKKAFKHFLLLKGTEVEKTGVLTENSVNGNVSVTADCCRGLGNFTCCQTTEPEIQENDFTVQKDMEEPKSKKSLKEADGSGGKGMCSRKIHSISKWFENWEREDTYAALAVVTAIASIAVAYSCYKNVK